MNLLAPNPGFPTGARKPRGRVNGGKRYWAFLSYAHADSAAADRLHRKLETFRLPKTLVGAPHPTGTMPERLTPIFRDRHELAASSDLGREIEEALAASHYLIVLCSPAAARSRWVDQEVRDFKRVNGEDRVLAAILDGEPFATDEAEECFPPSLKQRIDGTGNPTGELAEPIAADLRDGGDGWRTGSLKIIAGLLDLGLDDLIQRDQQRRQKRMRWILAASLAGMAFTTGLSIVALDARDTARDERRQAESLVGFMLGDLRDELEPIGRLDALDKVGEKALAYYASQNKKELGDDQLAQRSRALNLLGQIAKARGDSVGALARYREAMRGTAELVERYPEDPQKLFDHAQNVFYVGEIVRDRGELEQAGAAYGQYQALARRMVAADPANPKWQMEVLYARENIGMVLYLERRFDVASRELQATAEAMEKMVARYPANTEYQSELINLLGWVADARRDSGNLELAIDTRKQQLAMLNELLADAPANTQLRERLLPALSALGLLYVYTGRPSQGVVQFRTKIAEASRLLTVEDKNAVWQGNLAAARLELAATLIGLHRITEATRLNALACGSVANFRRRDPKSAFWATLTTSCLMNTANLSVASNQPAEAVNDARQALQSARLETSVDPVKDHLRVASALMLLGDAQRASGDRVAAQSSWASALNAIPANAGLTPRELSVKYGLLKRLGRADQARELDARLNTMGFKGKV